MEYTGERIRELLMEMAEPEYAKFSGALLGREAVMLMDFYVVPDYIDELLSTFDGIHYEGYYVKMAIAWALSVCLVKQWEKSFAYMCSPDNHLDEFTYVKTVQKCRESFRLTKEQKELLTKEKEKRFAKRKVRNVQEK